jgi:hypothetical protein
VNFDSSLHQADTVAQPSRNLSLNAARPKGPFSGQVGLTAGNLLRVRYAPAIRAIPLQEIRLRGLEQLADLPDIDLREEVDSTAFALLQLDPVDNGAAHHEEPLTAPIFQLQGSGGTDVHAGTAADALRQTVHVVFQNK